MPQTCQTGTDKKTGASSTDVQYYISSLQASLEYFLIYIRGYWGIENQAHWLLDVVCKEGGCCIRKEYSAENLPLSEDCA